jgi:hypothetical protein
MLTDDGATLELAVDACPEGLSGEDPDWKLACRGTATLFRVNIQTKTWTTDFIHSLDPSLAISLMPGSLSFGILSKRPLLTVAGTATVHFGNETETVLPDGCAVGDTLYRIGETTPETPSAFAPDVAVATPAPSRVHRFSETGAEQAPLALPDAPKTDATGSIACSSDSLFLIQTHLGNGTKVDPHNSTLRRFNNNDWSDPLWTGNLGQFGEISTATPYISVIALPGEPADTTRRQQLVTDGRAIIADRTVEADMVDTSLTVTIDNQLHVISGSHDGRRFTITKASQ